MGNGRDDFLTAELGLSDLINAFSTAIFVKDRAHRCVMLNEACRRALGRPRKKLIGKTDYDFIPKAQADKIWNEEERIFASGRESSEEESLTDRKGVERSYTTTKTLFTDRAGRVWLIGVMNDVTVHKRVLGDSRFMASLLEAENEASLSGILIVDEAERILTANRRFREMWGIPAEVLESKSDAKARQAVWDKIVDPASFKRRVDYLYRHREEKSRDEVLLRDGRIFDRYSAPVVGKDGVYYGRVWHFRDITELRKLEALRTEVKQRRELDVLKDKFIDTVSHELRTPLTIVRTAVDTLRGGVAGALSPKQQEVSELCSRNILRLNKMINNLLQISRLESGRVRSRLERVDLRPLLADLEANVRMIGRAGGREISIHVDAPPSLPKVRADCEMIAEVLYNLLDNAARFARSSVRVKVRRESGGVRVDVVDDGPGIPPDRIPLIFDKFYQVERSVGGGYKGTGLGLAICKEIMTMHGSEIAVASEPGKGADFHFFLPAWSAPPAASRHPAPRHAVAGHGRT